MWKSSKYFFCAKKAEFFKYKKLAVVNRLNVPWKVKYPRRPRLLSCRSEYGVIQN